MLSRVHQDIVLSGHNKDKLFNREKIGSTILARSNEEAYNINEEEIQGCDEPGVGDLQAEYVAEGNANLVISIKEKGIVIRLPKSENEEEAQKLEYKIRSIPVYIDRVLRPLFGDKYLVPIHGIVNLSPNDLECIRESLKAHRPALRKHRDIYLPLGLVMPDLTNKETHFPGLQIKDSWLAVELKAKSGHIIQQNCPHPHICNFCLKQCYKESTGAGRSDYCPLDLFSGDVARVQHAISLLLDNPQNYIRLFGEGKLLHDETNIGSSVCQDYLARSVGGQAGLTSLLSTALTSPNHHTIRTSPLLRREDSLAKSCGRNRLQSHSKKIHSAQKTQTTASVRTTSSGQANSDGELSTEESGSEDSVLDSILKLQAVNSLSDHEAKDLLESLICQGLSINQIHDFIINQTYNGLPFKEQLDKLRNYMVYCTAKDVSIFIMFAKEVKTEKSNSVTCDNFTDHSSTYPTLLLDDETYIYSIKVTDLDPKHISSVDERIRKKEKWMKSCQF